MDDIDKQENHDDQYINSSEHKLKADDHLEMCRLNDPFPIASFYVSNITTLEVIGLHNSEYLMSVSVASSFVHLKKLSISWCESMKEVVFTKEFRQGRSEKIELFSSLKKISLSSLQNLERFCRGYNDMEYLLNLKELVISDCGNLTTFISNPTDDQEPEEHLVSRRRLFHDQKVPFPKLKSLSLSGHSPLPRMDHEEFLSNLVMLDLCNDVPKLLMDILGSHQCGARTTVFQNLECLQLRECEKLKKLSMPSWGFQALTVLCVWSCDGMEYLLTPSTAKSLPLLKAMDISGCRGMREIIRAKDDDDEDDDKLQGSSSTSSGSLKNNNIVFHHLEFLVLDSLTSLTCFHSGNCALKFPKLSQLAVYKCPKMRNFCAYVIVTAPKLHTFMYTRYMFYVMTPELDSNDHVQVDYRVRGKSDMNIEQLKEDGGDKYININASIQHFWETHYAL